MPAHAGQECGWPGRTEMVGDWPAENGTHSKVSKELTPVSVRDNLKLNFSKSRASVSAPRTVNRKLRWAYHVSHLCAKKQAIKASAWLTVEVVIPEKRGLYAGPSTHFPSVLGQMHMNKPDAGQQPWLPQCLQQWLNSGQSHRSWFCTISLHWWLLSVDARFSAIPAPSDTRETATHVPGS